MWRVEVPSGRQVHTYSLKLFLNMLHHRRVKPPLVFQCLDLEHRDPLEIADVLRSRTTGLCSGADSSLSVDLSQCGAMYLPCMRGVKCMNSTGIDWCSNRLMYQQWPYISYGSAWANPLSWQWRMWTCHSSQSPHQDVLAVTPLIDGFRNYCRLWMGTTRRLSFLEPKLANPLCRQCTSNSPVQTTEWTVKCPQACIKTRTRLL